MTGVVGDPAGFTRYNLPLPGADVGYGKDPAAWLPLLEARRDYLERQATALTAAGYGDELQDPRSMAYEAITRPSLLLPLAYEGRGLTFPGWGAPMQAAAPTFGADDPTAPKGDSPGRLQLGNLWPLLLLFFLRRR